MANVARFWFALTYRLNKYPIRVWDYFRSEAEARRHIVTMLEELQQRYHPRKIHSIGIVRTHTIDKPVTRSGGTNGRRNDRRNNNNGQHALAA